MQPDFDISLDFDELDTLLDAERERLESRQKLRVMQFTDPLCGWCYGMEPAMTKLRFLLADQLEFSYTMGLMIPSVPPIFGSTSDTEHLFSMMKQQLMYGFAMIEQTTGMPMSIGQVEHMKPADVTSLESSLGYEAVKIVEGPERAIDFMRMLRQSVYAFETPIGAREDIAMLANLFGTNMQAYDQAIESGEARQLLDDEVKMCRSLQVDGFPTLLITYGSNTTVLHGYQTADTLAQVIAQLSDGAVELPHPEYSEKRVLELLKRFDCVAGEELRCTFDLTLQELVEIVNNLIEKKLVDIIPCGRSFFVRSAAR